MVERVARRIQKVSFAVRNSTCYKYHASSNKCHASSNRCLTSSNKKLVVTTPFAPCTLHDVALRGVLCSAQRAMVFPDRCRTGPKNGRPVSPHWDSVCFVWFFSFRAEPNIQRNHALVPLIFC